MNTVSAQVPQQREPHPPSPALNRPDVDNPGHVGWGISGWTRVTFLARDGAPVMTVATRGGYDERAVTTRQMRTYAAAIYDLADRIDRPDETPGMTA